MRPAAPGRDGCRGGWVPAGGGAHRAVGLGGSQRGDPGPSRGRRAGGRRLRRGGGAPGRRDPVDLPASRRADHRRGDPAVRRHVRRCQRRVARDRSPHRRRPGSRWCPLRRRRHRRPAADDRRDQSSLPLGRWCRRGGRALRRHVARRGGRRRRRRRGLGAEDGLRGVDEGHRGHVAGRRRDRPRRGRRGRPCRPSGRAPQPELARRLEQARRNASTKGWRWIAEMEEIAATFEAAGQPDGFHRAAADVYRRWAGRVEGDAATEVVIDELGASDEAAGRAPPRRRARGTPAGQARRGARRARPARPGGPARRRARGHRHLRAGQTASRARGVGGAARPAQPGHRGGAGGGCRPPRRAKPVPASCGWSPPTTTSTPSASTSATASGWPSSGPTPWRSEARQAPDPAGRRPRHPAARRARPGPHPRRLNAVRGVGRAASPGSSGGGHGMPLLATTRRGEAPASVRRGARGSTTYTRAVPVYEYRCRTCDDVFEVRRPMSESSEPATAPTGTPVRCGCCRSSPQWARPHRPARPPPGRRAFDGLWRRVRLLPGLSATGRAQRSP